MFDGKVSYLLYCIAHGPSDEDGENIDSIVIILDKVKMLRHTYHIM